jgi:hypothetical protein
VLQPCVICVTPADRAWIRSSTPAVDRDLTVWERAGDLLRIARSGDTHRRALQIRRMQRSALSSGSATLCK